MKLFNKPGYSPAFLIRDMFCFLLVLLFANSIIHAQDELDILYSGKNKHNWMQFSDVSNSLYWHISSQAYEYLEKRKDDISGIHSLADWQQRQDWLKETLHDIIGPFPEKTPLNAKILRTVEKDSYKVDHIIFESRPGYFVTSSMFIPKKLKGRSPVIIHCSGHSATAYRVESFQHLIINLVKKGFIVFAIDPIGQGERIQYYDPETKRSKLFWPTLEHSYPGSQIFLTGNSMAGYMTWDGIRAVDYLLTRKEVDSIRIGITGISGGGTQTALIAAMDERIYAAAPECFITNFTRLFQSIGPQDAEQNLLSAVRRGFDHPDFLAVRAPKPALMVTTTNDFFNMQGARETEKEVSLIYSAYSKEENFGRVEDIAGHASTKKNREAMYAFFQNHLNNPGSTLDEEVELLSEDEIRVTPTGQVVSSFNSETAFSVNRKDAEKLMDKLNSSRAEMNTHLPGVIESAKNLCGYLEPEYVDKPVFSGRLERNGYIIEKYHVKGEGNYPVPYLLMIPEKPNNRAIIYLHPSGKSAEASEGGEMEWFVRQGFTVLSPDLIGMGETGPGDYKGDAYINGTSHNLWYATILIGRSMVGIRAGDVNRLALLLKEKLEPDEIYSVARGEIAPVLLHAAAFNPLITRVALIEPYPSYRSLAFTENYKSSFITGAVPASLASYDLPDLSATLAPGKLLMVNITDAKGEIAKMDSYEEDLSVIRKAFMNKNADNNLKISSAGSSAELFRLLTEWLEL